jgi:putative aldouronate transport system permease protein
MPSRSLGEKIFNVFNLILLSGFALLCLYPFVYILALSFNEGRDAVRGGVFLFPRVFSLENYTAVFTDSRIVSSFLISVFRTVMGAFLGVLVNALFAFALSKRDLPLRKFLNWFIVIPMYFGAGIIPYYLICRALGLINNIWVYVLPWLSMPFYIMLMRISILDLPPSLEESAKMDGAGYIRIFGQIVLPLIMPSIATVALLGGIFHWNDWLDGTILTSRSDMWPLQTLLLNILQGADMANLLRSRATYNGIFRRVSVTPESLKMAMLVITVLPVFLVYPFAQKYFIRGMMVGSIKE